MFKSILFLAFMIFFACSSRKEEEISKAIQLKEAKKGNHMESYFVLQTKDSLGFYKVYYEAEISPGPHGMQVRDSVRFYVTGDGILQYQP